MRRRGQQHGLDEDGELFQVIFVGRIGFGVAAGTTLTYNGTWPGGGENGRSAVVLRDGAKFIAAPDRDIR